MKTKSAPLLISMTMLVLLASAGSAYGASGDIFARIGSREAPVFHIDRTSKVDGDLQTLTVRFTTPDGSEAARETAVLRRGRLVRSELVQRQTGETGVVELSGTRATFRWGPTGAATETVTEDVSSQLVVTPAMLPSVVTTNWARLASGESLGIRLVAFSRKETVGFTVTRSKEPVAGGSVMVKVVPTSPFIRILVDPLLLTFDATGEHLRRYVGRTALKRRDGSSWKDFDGETVYRPDGG